jgi:prephenate dehydrogenase
MDPVEHDQTLAWTSHLVHVLAYTLAAEIDRAGSRIFDFAGPSLRDATRVAASSPELWRDILLENRVAVGHALARLTRALENFGGILQAADEPGLLGLLEAGRSARRRLEGAS